MRSVVSWGCLGACLVLGSNACVGDEPDRPATAADAGASLDAGGSLDAAGTTDSGGEAIADAGPDAHVSPCIAGASHAFCADFDEAADVTSGWTFSGLDKCTYGIVDSSVGAPKAAHFVCPPTAAAVAKANLTEQLAANGKRGLRVELDFRWGGGPAQQAVSYFAFFFTTAATPSYVFGVAGAGDTWSISNSVTQQTMSFSPPAPNTWVHAIFELVFSSSTDGLTRVTLDDTVVVEKHEATLTAAPQISTLDVQLGPFVTSGTTPKTEVDIDIDNVTIDLE